MEVEIVGAGYARLAVLQVDVADVAADAVWALLAGNCAAGVGTRVVGSCGGLNISAGVAGSCACDDPA
jgi:hypothetical protein